MNSVPFATLFGRQESSRRLNRGWLLSAVLHAGLLALLVYQGQRLAAEAARMPGEGPGLGGGGGGGWGRAFAVFSAPASAAVEAPAPPAPEPEPRALEVPQNVVPLPEPSPDSLKAAAAAQHEPAAAPVSGQGTGAGTGTGPGAGPGSGGGAGGGSGGGIGSGVGPDSGGAGGRIFPPQPRGIILTPAGAPRELRGVQLTVTFTISERGEVLDVEVTPPIRDRGYRNEFLERMRRYTFSPARALDGRPLRATYEVLVTVL